ncbi:MAG TPA: hypothetical protein VH394_26825 [Thermoanaerobaculia bacterium]|jgi:hypothetical protein|nr:hypothetical protein [Thermoanaerobaculia bacterium]
MFENLITYPIESPLLAWESKVVVRADEGKERLYLRLKLTGTKFPIFNSIPFVRVGEVKARYVEIADDGLSVKAYFDTAIPQAGPVEFGYDDQVLLRFPGVFHSRLVARLDDSRLPEHLRYQDRLLGLEPPR